MLLSSAVSHACLSSLLFSSVAFAEAVLQSAVQIRNQHSMPA